MEVGGGGRYCACCSQRCQLTRHSGERPQSAMLMQTFSASPGSADIVEGVHTSVMAVTCTELQTHNGALNHKHTNLSPHTVTSSNGHIVIT